MHVIAKANICFCFLYKRYALLCVQMGALLGGKGGRGDVLCTCAMPRCDIIIVLPNFGSVFASPSTQCMAPVDHS